VDGVLELYEKEVQRKETSKRKPRRKKTSEKRSESGPLKI
jgi:hypothetical protein